MSQNENICPKCGAMMNDFCELQEKVVAPYGAVKDYIEQVSACGECGYEISDDTDGSTYRALYEKSVAESIPAILDLLNQSGYSMVATERILELPFRTLSRWKTSGKPSAGGTALLRLLATFPWLLEVADSGYDKQFAENRLMIEWAKACDAILNRNNLTWQMQVENPNKLSITIASDDYAESQSDNYLLTDNNF